MYWNEFAFRVSFWSLIKTSQSSLFRSAVTIPVISPLGSTPPIISPPKTLQYGHEEDTREERENLPERGWKSFPALYHKACVTGNMVQKISGRVSPRSALSPFQAPATKATHEVSCNHCFPHTRSLGFVAWGQNAWPSQNGSSFNTGHVLSSWRFHRIKSGYIVCTRGFFSPATEIFSVGRRPKPP